MTSLNFKDGKIKYEIISLEMKGDANEGDLNFVGGLMAGWSIYNKKGVLKRKMLK